MKKVLEINVDDLHAGGVFSLVKNVIINNKNDIKIDIASIEHFTNQSNIDLLNSYGSDVYFIGSDKNKLVKQFECYKHTKELLKKNEYDCVHIHSDSAYKVFTTGLASKRAHIKKIIIHSHSSGIDGHHRSIKIFAHKVLSRFLKYIGTDFVACSGIAARWMFPNITPDKIVIINNGIDLEKFRYNEETRVRIRKELNIDNELLLGFVGRFAYQKNNEYLIRIFNELKKQVPASKLLLIGEGPDEEQVRALVNDMNLADDVVFYGVCNKVHEMFQAMDVFLLPSRFEGLPIVGVEAQAAGLPVIFSDKITSEAKIVENVSFIGISDEDIHLWVEALIGSSKKQRVDSIIELKNRKFDITDTINSLSALYFE